ncbi:hypothetical protein LOD99_15388 [Oopsacas minuta]|uniref:Uncharacterized protein n=1 Tax=Oopsacas minuta TaxID=111878 RepID=A0AAV7KBN0_9METZ|nr:hypothetical protein LOD99_15388 [Oopsacas minuta]
MQKLRDKKSKQQTNKQSDIYEPEYPTEVVEKKIYQKAAIKYPINNDQERKSEEKHESDWVTKSKNK